MSINKTWIMELHRVERYMSDKEHGAAKALLRRVILSMEIAEKQQRENAGVEITTHGDLGKRKFIADDIGSAEISVSLDDPFTPKSLR